MKLYHGSYTKIIEIDLQLNNQKPLYGRGWGRLQTLGAAQGARYSFIR